MRRHIIIAMASSLLLAVGPVMAADGGSGSELLRVDNGDLYYDTDGDCVGDTNDPNAPDATALRHWHVGLPFVGAEAEFARGYGCLDNGEPQRWTITVSPGHVATVEGDIRYTWDQQVPGGGENDVHLHAFNADGDMVASTLLDDGPQPVVPAVLQTRTHHVSFTLEPGAYTLAEDVFSGEHTAWLTDITVTETAVSG